jgi:hypothetical protein
MVAVALYGCKVGTFVHSFLSVLSLSLSLSLSVFNNNNNNNNNNNIFNLSLFTLSEANYRLTLGFYHGIASSFLLIITYLLFY